MPKQVLSEEFCNNLSEALQACASLRGYKLVTIKAEPYNSIFTGPQFMFGLRKKLSTNAMSYYVMFVHMGRFFADVEQNHMETEVSNALVDYLNDYIDEIERSNNDA